MKKTQTAVAALLALSMGIASVASAQDRDRSDRRDNRHERQVERQSPPQNWRGGPPPRQDERRADWRGAGPDHNFRRGGRLPPQYRSRTYVVDDWRGHRLSAPPRGYHWVQTGSDYVLAAIATGVILQVLLNQ